MQVSTDDHIGRVLLVQYSAHRDGSAFSALLLADGLREAGWETHVAFAHEGPVIERFRAAGHRVWIAAHNSWLRSARYLSFARNVWEEVRAARKMAALFAEVRPDVVYLNTSVSLAGAVAASRHGVPCVWHLRELWANVGGELVAPPALRPAVRRVFPRLAARVVVNSKAVAANVLGRLSPGAVVVPNAVSRSFFAEARTMQEARRALGLPPAGPLIGVPGTLRPMKGHPFFLEAVAPLLARRPGVRVAIPGSGRPGYADALQALAERLGIRDRVLFIGSIDDMAAFYRACDVVCIPSSSEPFGRTVIEAYAVGVPVVATAVGGIVETVVHGETGLLVSFGDNAQLGEALARVLDDPALGDRLRTAARARAEAEFHEGVYQRRLCEVVASLAGSTSVLPIEA